MKKQLIINADDYGACREVNSAVEYLVKEKRVQSVSALANSESFVECADFLRQNSQNCAVGIHLNAVEGRPLAAESSILTDKNGNFLKLHDIFLAWIRNPLTMLRALELEWSQQIERLKNSGLEISHADSHQHIHSFPPFWHVFLKICRKYKIPCLRIPFESINTSQRIFSAVALNGSAYISKTLVNPKGFIYNDYFLGFKRAGNYQIESVIEDLKKLKNGVTEISFHPSLRDYFPYATLSGKTEYDTLFGGEIFEFIKESKIELTNWKKLAENAKNDKVS